MTPDLAARKSVANLAGRKAGSGAWAIRLAIIASFCLPLTMPISMSIARAEDAKQTDAKSGDAKGADSKSADKSTDKATELKPGELQVWTPDQFTYKELHGRGDDEKPALLSYKEVEDDQSKSGTALSINVNNRLLRKGDFVVLKSPTIKDLPVGAYRVTVRMKMQGLLNALGSRVDIDVSGTGARPVYMNEFKEEDAYQEFTVDYEVREPDIAFLDPDEFCRKLGKRNNLTPADIEVLKPIVAGYKGAALKAPKEASAAVASAVQTANNLGKTPDSITVTLTLPQTPNRGDGPPPAVPSLRRLTFDTIKVTRIAEPDSIVVRDIVPQYAWRRPGENQVFSVTMHNRTKSEKSASLRLIDRFGLTGEETINEKPVKLKAGGTGSTRIAWTIPKDHALWGQEVEAQLVVDGQVQNSTSSWFTIHTQNNPIVIPGQGRSSLFHRLYSSVPTVQTHQEYWAPTPYDGAGLVPDDDRFNEPYIAGNSLKEESISKQAQIVNDNLARGIATFFYTEVHGTGLKAYQYFFEHPEMCQGFGGAAQPNCTDEMLDKRAKAEFALRVWVAGGRKGPQPELSPHVGFVGLNGYYKETVDIVTNGTLKLLDNVPYTGIRWDSGLPFEVFANNGLGESLGLTSEAMAKKQIENLQGYKAAIRAKFPQFEVRGNWTSGELAGPQKDPFDFDKARAIMDADVALKELIGDGGSILEEGWYHSFGGYNDYKNVCRNYFRAAVFESAAFKSVGGYHDHMMYGQADLYSPDMIYMRLLSLLGGAHLSFVSYGPIPESDLDLGVFATRFGEFFWDTHFEPIRGMDQKIRIDTQADIWATEGGWQRTQTNGNLLYVLPIINPPVTERWFKNRFYVLPAPIRTPLKTYVKIPDGYKAAKVFLLDNKPQPIVRALDSSIDKGEVQFEIPELILFKVVAVEFSK